MLEIPPTKQEVNPIDKAYFGQWMQSIDSKLQILQSMDSKLNEEIKVLNNIKTSLILIGLVVIGFAVLSILGAVLSL